VLKTRLYLTEDNLGDAEATLELAAAHLARAAALAPEQEQDALGAIQAELTAAAGRLREQPVIAGQDLESAWFELGTLIEPDS
jgi:hypothetical protein